MDAFRQKRGRILKRIVSDGIIMALGGVVLLLFRFTATPFHRGFFCNDESLMHPFKDSTVTSAMLYGIGFCLTFVVMTVVEAINAYSKTGNLTLLQPPKTDIALYGCRGVFLRNWYLSIVPFIFGAIMGHITTDIGKYSVGRLRPHFFSVCNLNMSQVACSDGYIEDFVCSGDANRIREVRLSFPSGHASFSSYVAMYLMIYFQKRVVLKVSPLLCAVLQAGVLYLGVYTCLSRISDYKHHWSDVLAGAIIGVVSAAVVAYCVSDLFRVETSKQGQGPQYRDMDKPSSDPSIQTNCSRSSAVADEDTRDIATVM